MNDRAYIQQLAGQLLDGAADIPVPCPGHPQGPLADLHVQRRHDGHGDGWAVLDNDHTHAWTGLRWIATKALSAPDVYHYPDLPTAHAEAERIAPLETETFRDHLRRLYRQHEKETSHG